MADPHSTGPKKPTPVDDDITHEQLTTLIERTGKLAYTTQQLLESQESMRKTLARDVAKGVFFGSLAVSVLAFLLLVLLPQL